MKRLAKNTIASLIQQITGIVCGLVLPRLYLVNYGSAANGLVSSIANFLGFILFLDMGMTSVISSALYQPLAERNHQEISRIMRSARKFFRGLAAVLIGYCVIMLFVYPNVVDSEFGIYYIAGLILISAVNSFFEYYFGLVDRILLNADQRAYIPLAIDIFTSWLNLLGSAVLISLGYGLPVVMLATAFIFLLRPALMGYVIRKEYQIDWNITVSGNPIPQKWNGAAQHVAYIVLQNTDIVVLSVFSTLENVSVYVAYNLVQRAVKQFVGLMNLGLTPLMGNLLARKEEQKLSSLFDKVEWIYHTVTTYAFTVTGILILPFIQVYTKGITDAGYHAPLFAVLLTLAGAAYCYRIPYHAVTVAAGHYRSTQMSSIIEAAANIILSVALVFRLGLAGVAVGTLAAVTYRTIYLVFYLSNHLLKRPVKHFLFHMMANGLAVMLMLLCTAGIRLGEVSLYFWFIMSGKVAGICMLVMLVVNIIFYHKLMRTLWRKVRVVVKSRSKSKST